LRNPDIYPSVTGTRSTFLWPEVSMKREDEYRQLARDVLRRASEEQSAQVRAQWEILGARYMERTTQAKKSDDDQSH
jgi:hypothetical protein